MKLITVEISAIGTPRAKGRPRMARNGHVFTPPKTKQAATILSRQMKTEIGNRTDIFEAAHITVDITYHMPIPKTYLTTKGDFTKSKRFIEEIGMKHTVKPDIDNLNKLVYDAGNGILWKDDNIIAEESAIKMYTKGVPRTELSITYYIL